MWAFIIQATMSRLPNVEEPSSKLHTKIFYKNQMFDCFKTTPPLHRDHLKQNGYSHIRIKHNSLTLLLVLITWIERINGRYSAFVKANITFSSTLKYISVRRTGRVRNEWVIADRFFLPIPTCSRSSSSSTRDHPILRKVFGFGWLIHSYTGVNRIIPYRAHISWL